MLASVLASLGACSDAATGTDEPSDVRFDLHVDLDVAADAPSDTPDLDAATDVDVAPDVADEAPDVADAAPDEGDGDGSAGDAAEDAVTDPTPGDAQDVALDLAEDVAEDADLADASDLTGCVGDEECGFGQRCDVDHCVPLECHLGDYAEGIADKPCPAGEVCEVLVDPEGGYVCVAFERSCTFQSDCPFGFRCEAGSCALSDCTVGNEFSGYGPRLCEVPGDICACMEDGSEINGGRGVCVTDPLECP